MGQVHRLWHIHEMLEYEEERNLKTLGIYTSLLETHDSIAEYSKIPGFKNQKKVFFADDDYEAGFLIGKHTIGDSSWKEGYACAQEFMAELYGTVFTEEEEEDTDLIIDIPYWAKDEHPHEHESAVDFATRLIATRYGDVPYPTGPESEFFQIKKLCEVNNFSIPKVAITVEATYSGSSNIEDYGDSKDEKPTNFIYLVHHINPSNDDVKDIGVYSSLTEAEEIVQKYKRVTGFKDSPEGFYIDPYILDRPYWQDGYYSVLVKRT